MENRGAPKERKSIACTRENKQYKNVCQECCKTHKSDRNTYFKTVRRSFFVFLVCSSALSLLWCFCFSREWGSQEPSIVSAKSFDFKKGNQPVALCLSTRMTERMRCRLFWREFQLSFIKVLLTKFLQHTTEPWRYFKYGSVVRREDKQVILSEKMKMML